MRKNIKNNYVASPKKEKQWLLPKIIINVFKIKLAINKA